MKYIKVEVVHARPGAAQAVALSIPQGSTVAEAVGASRLPHDEKFGIFGEVVKPDFRLRDGDRVEIYRALALDPKEARRRRARPAQKRP